MWHFHQGKTISKQKVKSLASNIDISYELVLMITASMILSSNILKVVTSKIVTRGEENY